MSDNFEEKVMSSLEKIEARLSSIEDKIDEATNFTSSVLGEDGMLPDDGLEAIKSTFASLLNPGSISPGSMPDGLGQQPQDIGGLVNSLRSFQDRLSSVKEALADLSEQDSGEEK